MNYLFVCLVLSFLTVNISYAQTGLPATIYKQCSGCHGQNAQGNKSLKAPALANQYAWYLERQLLSFKNDLRGKHKNDGLGSQMMAIAKTLSRSDIVSISQYLSSLPQNTDVISKNDGNLKNGTRYYQGKCGACHGGKAQGNKAFNAPKLAGLSATYLKRQMLNFTQGIRGTHKQDKLGRQMSMMAKTTAGTELDDILFYISEQNTNVDVTK